MTDDTPKNLQAKFDKIPKPVRRRIQEVTDDERYLCVCESSSVYSSGEPQYLKAVELYIRDHQDQLTIQKLKRNKAITQADLDVLEGLLLEASGMSDVETYREKLLQEKPLGMFIRELVGLDMNAAKEAFSSFLDEEAYNAEQIQFVDQVIDYLVNNGILDVSQLFEPPFTDNHGESAYGFFDEGTVVELFGVIRTVNANAVVAESQSA